MITREDVMIYSAMGAVCSTALAGLSYDADQVGLTWSFAVIAVCNIGALITAYLHTSKD